LTIINFLFSNKLYVYIIDIKINNVSVAINTLHNIQDQTSQELKQKVNTFASTNDTQPSNYNTVHYGKLLIINS